MSADTFTCEACGGTFPKAWSDAEALAESREILGEIPPDQVAVICDECYKAAGSVFDFIVRLTDDKEGFPWELEAPDRSRSRYASRDEAVAAAAEWIVARELLGGGGG